MKDKDRKPPRSAQRTSARRPSSSQFRTLADHIDQLAWMADRKGWIFWYNRRWYEYTGTTLEEMEGWGWKKVHHPDHVDRVVERIQQSWNSGEPWEDTFPLRGKDGGYRWFLSRAQPIRDEAGEVECWFGTNTDITDQRDAEQALTESRQRLELALGSAEMGVWEIDLETGEYFCDERVLSLLGVGSAEALVEFRKSSDRIYPEDSEALEALFQGLVEGSRERVATEFRVRRPDDGDRWLAILGVVRLEDDGVRRVYGGMMDITARKEAEERQRASEERLRLAQTTAMVGTFEYNIQTGVNRWSREIEALYGLLPGTFDGTYEAWAARVHPEDLPEAERRINESFRTGDFEGEWRAIWPDGTERWLAARAKVFMDKAGKPLRMIGANVDITERKQAERKLRRANEELERRVAERTAELAHRAEQLSRLTSELTLTEQRERRRLSNVLHDHLQQLLVGAKFNLQRLDNRLSESETAAFRQIDRLLDESIKASRSLTVELALPILHEAGLAAGLEWLARWMKERHGLIVHLDLEREVGTGREDVKTLVFQSVRELLLNVVKHSGADEASVELKAHGSERLRITVSDAGQGFNAGKVGVHTDVSGGFGLFSVRERMTLLGGSLEIASELGKGSRFTLIAPFTGDAVRPAGSAEVPRVDKAAPLPVEPAEKEDPKTQGPIPGMVRVLLVDDHEMICQGLSMLLAAHEDMEIVGQATNGREAVEAARRLRPDVVLMDFSMPEMDGVEATRRLRGELPEVQVIGLSMYEESDRAAAMLEAGAAAYLTKGGSTDVLLDAIRRVYGKTAE